MKKIRILWLHNFSSDINNSGIFMHQTFNYINNNLFDLCTIEYMDLGSMRNPFNIINSIFKLRKISKSYEITHSQFGSMCGFIGIFSLSKLKVITVRGSDWYGYLQPGANKFHGLLQAFLTRFSLIFYNRVVAVSNRMAREITSFRNFDNLLVLPSPVDEHKFTPLNRSYCRSKLGWSTNKKYFIFPVLNGKNSIKRPSFVEKISKLLPENIEIVTVQGIDHNNLSCYYSAADCIILPSIYEGWPNVIKEGLLCNIPYISSDVSDLQDFSKCTQSCKVLPIDVNLWVDALVNFSFSGEDLRSKVLHMNLKDSCKKLVQSCYIP